MNKRITMENLQSCVDRLNMMVNGGVESYINGKPKPGAYVLDGAYGGWQLSRYCNAAGAVSEVSCGGYVSKRELWDIMQSIITFHYHGGEK